MIIDQSLMDRTGRVLIARKTSLDAFMIKELGKMGVGGVYIREGEEEPEELEISPQAAEVIQKLEKEDKKKVKLTESVKKRVSEGIQFLYSDTSNNAFTDTANNIAGDLMKAISENDAVALNIDALKISDEYTFKHSVDVATMAMIIAKQMQMSQKDVYNVGVAGLLHDVGKSKIPNEILNKPGRLSEEEFEIMKQHSVYGYRILKEKEGICNEILMGVLQHHEKINGKGYPMNVLDKQICPYARILSVVDIYDALVTERPYKKAFSQRDAVEMLMSMTEELDINAMKSFLTSVILYPVGSIVSLSNGERARVVENNPGYPMRPKLVNVKTGKVYDLSGDVRCASIIIE
ncbi:MAG: HD-GYP domain-containing protein [Lachnospiraceae bacterium]|nr:HD-GYP domain-containing protein [Lachnospiraceae bacterium]